MTQQWMESVNCLAEIVRSYVAANPDASDTAEAIVRWWVPATIAPETIYAAIRVLTDEGVLVRQKAPDGSVRFSGPGARSGSDQPGIVET
jgi:Fe2+ or Zn2+ uptake regulation protein